MAHPQHALVFRPNHLDDLSPTGHEAGKQLCHGIG